MKPFLITLPAVFLVLGLVAGRAARAEGDQYVPSDGMEQVNDAPFTAEELDDLLAPIALYPDPLLAQILPAATFADQIDLAARYVRQYGQAARIDDQPWDVSVKAVAHYPDVLSMMDQKYDWTVSLGQAYINQQQDVMDAIQRLRAEAEARGNLASTPEQQVVNEGGFISIDPVAPDVIYVPLYDPQVVYVETGYGFITFGPGFIIGTWLNRDCDWHGHRIYYHGWRGNGWIGRSRSHVHIRNSVYIDNRYRTITTNRKTLQHDTTRYREEIRRNVRLRPELPGRPAAPAKGGGQRPPTMTGSGAPVRPAPGVGGQRTPATGNRQPAPSPVTNVYRGRDVQRSQPASQTGYGGYGSNRDAASYRQRGQSSRGTMQQFTRPAPAQRPAVSRPTPAPRSVSRPAPAQRQPPSAPRPAPSAEGGRQQR
ncbi:DUF3300 domain-containing protein [Geobacter sp. AOG2]|uniref:DUF3300 domain-containing protein n=1 Tax=Geobacter sp. AOG2 TaxID=1566347 RepID=UPI00208C1A2E|nr:DUF3300 domain-containing protein [Geobacter sp. AOG2]GFE60489.1 hypothetical protein AOG2_10770 [Geobacter sp. AOG2]